MSETHRSPGACRTVHGELPSAIVAQLQQDLTRRLGALEQAPMVCEPIPSS